jgi:hypothetical protein
MRISHEAIYQMGIVTAGGRTSNSVTERDRGQAAWGPVPTQSVARPKDVAASPVMVQIWLICASMGWLRALGRAAMRTCGLALSGLRRYRLTQARS